jgi:CO/xanthine dehydrogenase FAD-binding subunit
VTPFTYLRPDSLDALLALAHDHGSAATLLAGGTDVMVRLRKGHWRPSVVIDLKKVTALPSEIAVIPGAIRIGARTVLTDIVGSAAVRRYFPALIEAALVVGSAQIRNRATLVGNICNASPAADTAPALLVYDASVNIVGRSGARRTSLDDFLAGPGHTTLARGEIVHSIDLPLPAAWSGSAFARLTRRQGVDLAIVSVCCLVLESGDVRFGFGAVGPRPFLAGERLEEAGTQEARDAAIGRMCSAASPISDLRASDEYRRAMIPVLARRALGVALRRLRRPAG